MLLLLYCCTACCCCCTQDTRDRENETATYKTMVVEAALTSTSWRTGSQSIWNRPLLSPRHWQGQRQQQRQQQQRQGQGLARTSPDWRPSTADCEERFYTQILDHFRHDPGGEEK
ncbi:unnamed protein product [Laminaria digitata]